jgi:hypothetical protein
MPAPRERAFGLVWGPLFFCVSVEVEKEGGGAGVVLPTSTFDIGGRKAKLSTVMLREM